MRPAIGRSVNCPICSILHGPSSGFYRTPPVEATMPTRACRIVAVTTGVLLAALGLLAFPDAIIVLWITAVVFIGPAVTMSARCTQSNGNGVPVGVAAAAATMAFSAILAGLILLLGPPLAVPLMFTVTATWGWCHRRSLRDDIDALLLPNRTTTTHQRSSTPKHPESPAQRPPRMVSPVEFSRNDITAALRLCSFSRFEMSRRPHHSCAAPGSAATGWCASYLQALPATKSSSSAMNCSTNSNAATPPDSTDG